MSRLLLHALIICGLVFNAYLLFVATPAKGTFAIDAGAYWQVDLVHPYSGGFGQNGSFLYAPPIALLFAPFSLLSWPVFLGVWYALLLSAVVWLGDRRLLLLLAFPPVAFNLSDGNIHLLLAAAIVIGWRYPAAWAFVLLTKVTPGIGLLWFAGRREWRNLAIALGATAAICGATFVVMPQQWHEWVSVLFDSAGTTPPPPALPIPLLWRLPFAALLVLWGARSNRAWVVPAGATLALPALWPGGFAILAACWRLPPAPGGYHAPDALRSCVASIKAGVAA